MSVMDKILLRVSVDHVTGCWNWQGASTPSGYGKVWFDGRLIYTHRATCEAVHGVIGGRQIDHLCRNTRCCNPDHLEAVTSRENIRRGTSLAAYRARQSHCKRGHKFDAENTYLDNRGRRTCRKCSAFRARLARRTRRDGKLVPVS